MRIQVIVFCLVLINFCPALADYGDSTPPVSGVWFITQDTFISNQVIIVPEAIKVSDNTELLLDGVTLKFPNSDQGEKSAIYGFGSDNTGTKASIYATNSKMIDIRIVGISLANMTLINCLVSCSGHDGNSVGLRSTNASGLVSYSTVQNCGKNVWFHPADSFVFEHSLFQHNEESMNVDGELQFTEHQNEEYQDISHYSNVTFYNCTFKNMTGDQIEAYSVSHFNIIGNTFSPSSSTLQFSWGHDNKGVVRDILVENNQFLNATIILGHAHDVKFSENLFAGRSYISIHSDTSGIELYTNQFDMCENAAIQYQDWQGSVPVVSKSGNSFGDWSYDTLYQPCSDNNNNNNDPLSAAGGPEVPSKVLVWGVLSLFASWFF